MSEVRHLTVEVDDEGVRLDRWFRRAYPGLTHGKLEKLLRGGQIRIDGKRAKAATRIIAGQVIRVPPMPSEASEPREGGAGRPEPVVPPAEIAALKASVIHRDDAVIALNKPAGLAVQGGTGQALHLDLMLDALRFGAGQRPKLVHRLDKDTSGLLLLARNTPAARAMGAAFRDRAASKIYWALVRGGPPQARGLIDLPVGKLADGGEREKMAVDRDEGQSAVTLYHRVARRGRKAAWLLLMPLTGRTHQLRVHCAAFDMPILGDGKYGGRAAFPSDLKLPQGLMLHARELAFTHPLDETTLRLQAPPPQAMLDAMQVLGFDVKHEADAIHALLDYKAAVEGWG